MHRFYRCVASFFQMLIALPAIMLIPGALLIDPAKFISAALPFLQSCGLPCTFLEERGLVLSPIVVLESRCFGVAMQCGFRGIGLPTLI